MTAKRATNKTIPWAQWLAGVFCLHYEAGSIEILERHMVNTYVNPDGACVLDSQVPGRETLSERGIDGHTMSGDD